MAVVTLDDIINDSFPELLDILKKDFRKELDARVTILDLSYEALKVNVYRDTKSHAGAYDNAYKILEAALSKLAKRKFSSLEDLPAGYFNNKNAPYVYIDGGRSNRFIIASSFGAIDSFVREVSRDKEVAKTSFGVSNILTQKKDSKGRLLPDEYSKSQRRKVDIGHISSEGSENLTSPLEEKLLSVVKFGTDKANPYIVAAAKKALEDLYSIQVSASYSFKNTAPEAISLAKNKLGEAYVVVTLHRQKLNNKFSKEEAQIFFKLKSALAKAISKQPYHLVSGSNNILQDIEAVIKNLIAPKQNKKPKKHVERTKTTKKANIQATVTATNSIVSIVKKPQKASTPTVSLVSLQALINSQLQDVVSANMGDGNSRNVLNYQTGRLAASAIVERLSQSRDGMITAFYSYMNNPYGTFSTGGKQQNPRSRDPKLLIARSIRDIASQYVSNRMRSVNV